MTTITPGAIWRRKGTTSLVKVVTSEPEVCWELVSEPTKGARRRGTSRRSSFLSSYTLFHELTPVTDTDPSTDTVADDECDDSVVERVQEIIIGSLDFERADVLLMLLETDRELATGDDIIRKAMGRLGGKDTLSGIVCDILDALPKNEVKDLVEDYVDNDRDVVINMDADELTEAIDARDDDLTPLGRDTTAAIMHDCDNRPNHTHDTTPRPRSWGRVRSVTTKRRPAPPRSVPRTSTRRHHAPHHEPSTRRPHNDVCSMHPHHHAARGEPSATSAHAAR